MRIPASDIKDTVRSMQALSGGSRSEGVMASLLALTQTLPPRGAKRQWDIALRALGRRNRGMDRFEVLCGIYKALLACDPEIWIRTWMLSLKAAAIHPVSLLLCSHGNFDDHQPLVESTFRKLNDEYMWFADFMDRVKGQSIYHRCWDLQVYPCDLQSRVLSTEPVSVEATTNRNRLFVGSDWCVYALTIVVPPFTRDAGIIFSDLTTISNLDLRYCYGQLKFQPTARIGGSLCADFANHRAAVAEGDLHENTGIRFRDSNYATRNLHLDDGYAHFPDPIVIPEGLASLLSHHPQHALLWT